MLALDTAPTPVEHGPDAYVGVAGNLLPGWALAMLALALLAPVALASFVAVADAARSPWQAGRAVGWAALRAVPFGLALLTVYMLAFTGVIPSPEFPFDPQAAGPRDEGDDRRRPRAGGPGRRRVPAAAPARAARLARAGRRGGGARPGRGVRHRALVHQPLPDCLLVAIGLQAWVPAAAGVAPGRLATAGLVALGTLPLLAAVADVAGRFDAGLGVVWDLLLLFTSGQTPDSQALLACLIAGCGLALDRRGGRPRGRGVRAAEAGSAGRARPPARGAARRVEAEEGAQAGAEGAAETEARAGPGRRRRSRCDP